VAAVAAVLLHQLTDAHWVAVCQAWALYATMALTVASGLQYSWVAARRVGAQPASGHGGK
jgi:hypothetical protein